MKKCILLVGSNGKMGTAVREKLRDDYFIVGFNKTDSFLNFGQNPSFDLVIDFGSAESSVLSAKFASKNKIPLIVGSTGQNQTQLNEIFELCKNIPYLICANFSIGIELLKNAINEIVRVDLTDICIFEKHHNSKKDSPSGTAIALKNYILSHTSKTNNDIQMLSLRGGKEFGTHTISFYFEDELIELSHTAFSRNAFACGVAVAVKFMVGEIESKKYTFEEILQKLTKY